jgi:hypothetical protein
MVSKDDFEFGEWCNIEKCSSVYSLIQKGAQSGFSDGMIKDFVSKVSKNTPRGRRSSGQLVKVESGSTALMNWKPNQTGLLVST